MKLYEGISYLLHLHPACESLESAVPRPAINEVQNKMYLSNTHIKHNDLQNNEDRDDKIFI